VTRASFDGHYTGNATLGVSGAESRGNTNPICVDARPMNMTIQHGYVTIWYRNFKGSTLHYRGRVASTGEINVSHLNGDGSRSVFTLNPSPDGWSGDMQRGKCWYSLAMTRS
jgi:hypothetical protein